MKRYLLLALLAVAPACVADACLDGSRGRDCYPNRTCDEGLRCFQIPDADGQIGGTERICADSDDIKDVSR